MPVTDLIQHYILTWSSSILVYVKEGLFTIKEDHWMEDKIPEMLEAGIIEYVVSPWSHQTKYVNKKDGGMRMVHVLDPINATAANHSYPMLCLELMINNLSQA
ncbi:hypothetical protein L873DRAFT_1712992 [Choiromyces venosus 120613-1]|uniref:Uncharacterized protein n=1 Tax=Choiromyces venosus 120613-1 TaxID=1336337 RepID=A0A3N4J075_9PEZI|nr:hypothetical protein L873DRAFT_1712992 [Choiromyces venosus 120613-1]